MESYEKRILADIEKLAARIHGLKLTEKREAARAALMDLAKEIRRGGDNA